MFFNNSGLLEVRDAMQLTLFPVVIIIVIYMIFGIFGNILVIIYYGFVQKQNPSFMFIVSMAMSDLTACTLSMPLEIVDVMEFYTFPSVAACKILRFVNYFVSCLSSLFLLWIAVDRYKKFCKPFSTQMSVRNARIIISSSVAIAIVVTCPNFIFYDIVPVNITNTHDALTSSKNTSGYFDDVIGYDCKTRETYRLFVTIYHGSLFLLFLIIIVSLVILYFHVIRKMLNVDHFREENNVSVHAGSKKESHDCINDGSGNCRKGENIASIKNKKKNSDKYKVTTNGNVNCEKLTEKEGKNSDHNGQLENETKQANCEIGDGCNEQKDETKSQETGQADCAILTEININSDNGQLKDESKDQGTKQTNCAKLTEINDDSDDNKNLQTQIKTKEQDFRKLKHHDNHVYTRRFTKITLSVTIAFVVSFLPYLGLMVWQTLSTDYQRLSGSALLIYNISIRSWLLNSVVNPIIYGFLNRHFRGYIINSFKKRACIRGCIRRT